MKSRVVTRTDHLIETGDFMLCKQKAGEIIEGSFVSSDVAAKAFILNTANGAEALSVSDLEYIFTQELGYISSNRILPIITGILAVGAAVGTIGTVAILAADELEFTHGWWLM
jgi:hypothetical protein